MRLVRTRIENFKLLEDISLDFSVDPKHPLTVVRAENGSGKTSLLYALLWAFYGMPGLPDVAAGLRLTSSAEPAGKPVDVSVMVEFEHTDDASITTRYRLVRSVVETPREGDRVDREKERVRLLRISAAGEDDVPAAEALISKLIPRRLRDVFFTNGDDVQTFISGRVSTQQRQAQVHKSIKMLLGLDTLRMAEEDLAAVYRRLRAEAAKSGGADTSALEDALEETDKELKEGRAEVGRLNEQLANMAEQRAKWDKELTSLRGIGDLDEINAQIERATRDKERFEKARGRALTRMREALRSEAVSWTLLGGNLDEGIKLLSDLADRNVIPGTSIEVLNDRLELEQCICGEPLAPGSDHRQHVERLRDDQTKISEANQRLTGLFHAARQARGGEDARIEHGHTFPELRRDLLTEFTEARDSLSSKADELNELVERRKLIDEERVRDLTEKLAVVDKQIADATEQLGRWNGRIGDLELRLQDQEQRLRDAEKAVKVGGDLLLRRDIAKDLHELAEGTLQTLEGDYVQRVSERMNDMFMEIVGSDPGFEAGVFQRVRIDDAYNIVVDTRGNRTLDPDFELNGASQRALTLSFIWALMEISGTTAPRIIDTPLGMVAGGVKTRMVDAITKPPSAGLPDFQVVLLLTRSEIRDVEELIDERAGIVRTLSNSKDFPEDLVHSWGADHPVSRICTCSHRQSCLICARRYDERHGIEFRDLEATV
jgi:DNA sulfur modification protein DndD